MENTLITKRRRAVFNARIAEQTKRFEDAVRWMHYVIKLGVKLSAEERNLLSAGYKGALDALRASRMILLSIKASNEKEGGDTQLLDFAKESLKSVEDELTSKCEDILSIINDSMLPLSTEDAEAVYYHTMIGDYHRYLAEINSGAEREKATSQSLNAYKTATLTAEAKLVPTNPMRLGLALNFSIFYYEIITNTERACEIAQKAHKDATDTFPSTPDESYEDSSAIMKLLDDNVTLWTHEVEEKKAAKEKAAEEKAAEEKAAEEKAAKEKAAKDKAAKDKAAKDKAAEKKAAKDQAAKDKAAEKKAAKDKGKDAGGKKKTGDGATGDNLEKSKGGFKLSHLICGKKDEDKKQKDG